MCIRDSNEARTTVDDEERVAKMQEADAMVAADCPVIPIMFYTHTIVGSDRIKHLYVCLLYTSAQSVLRSRDAHHDRSR